MKRFVAVSALIAALMGCASFKKADARRDPQKDQKKARLAKTAIELLDPANPKYDPDKGKAYLEFLLRNESLKTIEVPAAVLLDLLRSERVASERSHTLEQQLEIMKEIDMTKEGNL